MSENRYSRQILTLGKESHLSITNSSILVLGLKGSFAIEVLKNLVLQGVGTIYLQDEGKVTEEDSKTGFYYKNKKGEFRYQVLFDKLKVLNPFVKLEKYSGQAKDLTIYLNHSKLDDIQRPMIYSRTTPSNGFIFNDFKSYQVNDNDGESISTVPIKNITSDGYVSLSEKHNLTDTHKVIFKNIIGTDTIFLMDKKWSIDVKSPYIFKLQDFPKSTFDFQNGYVTRIKQPLQINHESFPKQLYNPTLMEDFLNPEFPKEQFNYWVKNKDITTKQNPVVNAYFGGLVASEAIKFVTSKYQPISQWYFWEDKHLSIPESIKDKKVFIVGSGAIGCELLKNLVMLGIKNITITDPDRIEESNLSRQFLFNQSHLNKSKSESAKETIETFQDELVIDALQDKMSIESEDKFNKEFYQNHDIIFNALDNYQARLYMDQQAIKYQLPLFESGTQGSKGNTQAIIPHVTEHYGASNDNDIDESYPVCTLKSFPNKPEHTIHWAKEKFEYIFNEFPSHVSKYVDNPDYIKSLPCHDKNKLIQEMNQLFKYDITKTKGVIKYFIEKYHKYFYSDINQLLHNFPSNKENSDGSLFWSAGKRKPEPIIKSKLKEYIITSINVFAQVSMQDYQVNNEEIDMLIDEYLHELKPTIIKNKFIPTKDEDIRDENEKSILNVGAPTALVPVTFEKDNDLNNHVEWIHLISSLRSENYGINQIDKLITRKIVGKIIPAMATTTSMVASLITLEMLKYLNEQNSEVIENYRSYFINSALNMYLYSEPIPPQNNSQGTTVWKKYIETDDITIKQFIDKWSEKFGIKINMIVNNIEMVYSDVFSDTDLLNDKLSSLVKKSSQLMVASCDSDELPPIYFNLS